MKNMYSKGVRGTKKKYFKPTVKKRKYKVDLVEGADVVFECRQKVFLGWVGSKDGDNSYQVHSCNNERQHTISWQDHPVMLSDLHVSSEELKKGDTYFVVWQWLDDFLELIPAQVVYLNDTYAWMKPDASVHDGCLKVDFDCIIKLNREKHELHNDVDNSVINLDHSEVNVAWLLLQSTQTQLENVSATYVSTLQKLKDKSKESETLHEQIKKLNDLNKQATETIKQYRKDLIKSQSLNQAANTLYSVIEEQKEALDLQEKQLLECDGKINDLREAFQVQQQQLITATMEITNLEKENTQLKETISNITTTADKDQQHKLDTANAQIKNLEQENSKLKEQVKCISKEKDNLFRMQQDPSSSVHVTARPAGMQKRGTAFIPLPRPSYPSSSANIRTLRRRADQVDKVLKAISAREEPSNEDIISTLAAYLRKHPEIAIPACQSAKIAFSKELNTKEAVDLKVLLKLPMKKLRELRRFLSNHNIKIFPSERPIYNELKARQSLSPEVVEIGVLQLQQTAQSSVSGVAFARVKNLKEYLADVITKQCEIGNTWTHPAFDDEVWLKVGGDKGGSSTKLVCQFVNQKNGNSADATNILAMFNGTDTYQNLSEVFSLYFDQLAELITLKTIQVNGDEKRLRIFLFGDYEFLCKYVGHMGPASSYPCLWCNISLTELRQPTRGNPHCPRLKESGWSQNGNWARPRSTEQYVQDYADMSNDTGTRPITGHMYHSISKKPLFPLCDGMDHIVPPSLHILLGLVVRYFNLVELECRKLDQGNLEERDLEQNAEWQTASENARSAETEYSESRSALEADEKLLKSFVRAKRGRDLKGLTSDPCSMPVCALASSVPPEVDRNNVQWIRCTQCGEGDEVGWYHAYCVGIKESDIDQPRYNEWICQVCSDEISGPEDVIPFQEERVASNKALTKQKEAAYDTAKKKLDQVYANIVQGRGQYEKKLNERLENDLHIKRQAYHSQCFVGNDCKTIVDNSEVLLQDLPDGECKIKYQGLFGRLRKIFKLFKAEFLSEEEVRELCIRCWELGYFFPKNFPEDSIPPKLHMLICHVPEIALRWKTIGLLSEQGLESMHASINAIQRVYVTVRDKRENMRLVLGCHQQRGVTSKKGLEVPLEKVRVCRGSADCKGRYLTQVDRGVKVRKCKKCQHVLSTSDS